MTKGERKRRVREIRARIDQVFDSNPRSATVYGVSFYDAKMLCNEIDALEHEVAMKRKPYRPEEDRDDNG